MAVWSLEIIRGKSCHALNAGVELQIHGNWMSDVVDALRRTVWYLRC